MASFTLVRELAELSRHGNKRLLLALYSASDSSDVSGGDSAKRYLACSEQERTDDGSPWRSSRKGITIRRAEINTIISALQSADFDAKSDNKGMSHAEYAKTLDW